MTKYPAFKTSDRPFFADSELKNIISKEFSSLIEKEDTHMNRDSEFSLEKIDEMLLVVYRYIRTHMGGSSHITLPNFKNKKAVISSKNKYVQCFK